MKEVFDDVRERLKFFIEHNEDSDFGSAINNLRDKLTNTYPAIPDIEHPLNELQSYSNKLYVANDSDVQKYYVLCLQRLHALEGKAGL